MLGLSLTPGPTMRVILDACSFAAGWVLDVKDERLPGSIEGVFAETEKFGAEKRNCAVSKSVHQTTLAEGS